jgi:hypothetical protein
MFLLGWILTSGRIVKVAGGQDPKVEITPSPVLESADEITNAIHSTDSSTRADQKQLKAQCLMRDGFRCVFSGEYDMTSYKAKLVQPPPDSSPTCTFTECAHIIPFALGNFDESKAIECQNKATIWYAIHRYFPSLKGKLHAGNINQPANAITLDPSVHSNFGAYCLSFWPQGPVSQFLPNPYFLGHTQDFLTFLPLQDHYYEIRCDVPPRIPPKSSTAIIHLESHVPGIPLPDREYFKLHHRIGQILEVSGIGLEIEREIDMAEWDAENVHPSGSTDIGVSVSRRMLINVRI